MPVIFLRSDNTTTDDGTVIRPDILPYSQGLSGVQLSTDEILERWLAISVGIVACIILFGRIAQICNNHIRQLNALTATPKQQNYWSYDKTQFWPSLKKHLLYAPLKNKRHNRECKVLNGVNAGTVPSRLHFCMLVIYIISNIAYILILDYKNENKASLIASLRGRTGALSTVNMILLIGAAGRNNPVIHLLRVSFDTFNLFHRWVGRMVIVHACIHTCAWAVNSFYARGNNGAMARIMVDPFLGWGAVGTICMILIFFQASAISRHTFYEVFLAMHQVLAFAAILGVYIHLEIANLPALPYIRIVVGLWAGDRILRVVRLIYLNVSRRNGLTTVTVKAMKGDACRVTFHLPRHVKVRPGSHVYAYIPRISYWMSHPFSVAWTTTDSEPDTGLRSPSLESSSSMDSFEKVSDRPQDQKQTPTSVSLVIQAQKGFTRQLFDRASKAQNSTITMTGMIEGPYCGHDSLQSYGTVIMFAGGAGITHHLVQIRHLIRCARAGTVATRRIVLVWTVRSVDQLAWVQPWMDEILQMEGRREILRIKLFVTKPRNPNEIRSPSTTVQMIAGRCQPGIVLDAEIPMRIGATAVSVCGPGAFTDEVRDATRRRVDQGSIDYMEEGFSW